MPHFNYGNYRVDIGKLVTLISVPKGRKGKEIALLVKPQSSTVHGSDEMVAPASDGPLSCRLMLGAAIGEKVTAGMTPHDRAIMGYGVVLDLFDLEALERTRRNGLPWTAPCMFDGSSIISEFVPASEIDDPSALEVYLEIDGKQKASLTTNDLICDVRSAIGTAARAMTLYPGDIVGIEVSGTENHLRPDSRIEAGISSVSIIRCSFKPTP